MADQKMGDPRVAVHRMRQRLYHRGGDPLGVEMWKVDAADALNRFPEEWSVAPWPADVSANKDKDVQKAGPLVVNVKKPEEDDDDARPGGRGKKS